MQSEAALQLPPTIANFKTFKTLRTLGNWGTRVERYEKLKLQSSTSPPPKIESYSYLAECS